MAGLTVLYIDVAHGGRIFIGRGGPVLWQHAVWLYGRPEVYGALLVPALGAVIDIVHPGLHREERPEARGGAALLTLAGVLSFTVWAAKASGRGAAVVPTFTPVAVLALVPAGLVVLYLVGASFDQATFDQTTVHVRIQPRWVQPKDRGGAVRSVDQDVPLHDPPAWQHDCYGVEAAVAPLVRLDCRRVAHVGLVHVGDAQRSPGALVIQVAHA